MEKKKICLSGGRKGPRYAIEDESRLRSLVELGWTDPAIARELGCSRVTVGNTRRRLGIAAARPRRRAS